MTADQTVERAANKLQQLANQLAGESGMKAKLAQPLAEDADLIRKMKPSLIKARAKGEAPTNQKPGQATVAPSGPQLGRRKKKKGAGPSSLDRGRRRTRHWHRAGEVDRLEGPCTPKGLTAASLRSRRRGQGGRGAHKLDRAAGARARCHGAQGEGRLARGRDRRSPSQPQSCSSTCSGFAFRDNRGRARDRVSTWLALLITTVILLAIAVVLGVLRRMKIEKGSPPVPEQAIREAKLTTEALKSDGQ